MQSLQLSILYCALLSVFCAFTTANPIIKDRQLLEDPQTQSNTSDLLSETQTSTIHNTPKHAPLHRRGSTSLFGPLKQEDVGDGWLASYDPLEPLVPRQQAAASLVSFYEDLKADFTTLKNENHPSNWLVEASEGGVGITMASETHDPVEWPVALSFCNWILAKTKRGWTGRYQVRWEHPATQRVITITLLVAGLFEFGMLPVRKRDEIDFTGSSYM